jgi:hypothetical protein
MKDKVIREMEFKISEVIHNKTSTFTVIHILSIGLRPS